MIEIPGYKIERELGAGGMATVHLALQENLHRQVALKIMTPGLAVDETYCHRFLKEGRIAAQLNHNNLLTVYDIGVHDNHYYMASEFLPGGTVRDKMNAGMTSDQVIQIISDIAQGLQYAHSKGFVHRDVKPGNMLFRANGDCVLGDFGIAKAVDSNTGATKLGTSIGTPHYMSPEQAKGEKVDHRTDLYSLGVVFYEMLVNKPPFDAEDPFSVALMQINEPVPDLPEEFQEFQPLINKLMEKDRESRYTHAEDFLDDLESITGVTPSARKTTRRKVDPDSSPTGARTAVEQAPKSTPQKSGPNWKIFVVPILALLVLGAVGWFAYKSIDSDTDPDEVVITDGTDDSSDDNTDQPPTDNNTDNGSQATDDPFAENMERAEALVQSGNLISPAGNNALEVYRGILAEDSDYDDARLAIRDLANKVEQQAELAWAKGELSEAYALLRDAVVAFPDDQGLRYLRDEIEKQYQNNPDIDVAQDDPPTDSGNNSSQQGNAADAGEISDLIAQADKYFDANIYSYPPGKNATEVYLKVLELDRYNSHALDRLDEIATIWANAAETNLKRGKVDLARKMIEKGLQARPDNAKLKSLQQRAEQAD